MNYHRCFQYLSFAITTKKKEEKMKKIKKLLSLMLVTALVLSLGVVTASTAEAADTNGEQIVAKALDYLNDYTTVSCNYNITYRRGFAYYYTANRLGMIQSTSAADHGFFFDSAEAYPVWEQYDKGERQYWKSYNDTKWTSYGKAEMYEATVYQKFQSYLSHLVNIKVTGSNSSYYTIRARISNIPENKKAVLTINRSNGSLKSIKLYSKDYDKYSLDGESTDAVTSEVISYTNIGYGNTPIILPDEL